MMKSPFRRSSSLSNWAGAAIVTLHVFMAVGTLQAAIIDSGDLLTVSSDGRLRSYTFDGTLQQTLTITGLPISGISASPQGVAVIENRLFIGLVSSSNLYDPKIVELDTTTGSVISVLDTAVPHLTALGDDDTNLLLLDSLVPAIPAWQVYTYTPVGALVSKVNVDRNSPGNFQGEGIDGDGQLLFMSTQVGTTPGAGQMVITDTTAGVFVSQFDTGMQPLVSFIGGLAYNRIDDTLWVAGNSEFHRYSRSGTLLADVNTLGGNTGVTGLEIIARAPAAAVPEPTSFALWFIGAFGCILSTYRRCNDRNVLWCGDSGGRELSQTLRQQRLTADYDAKHRTLEIVCLNCSLNGATLVPTNEKALRRTRQRARF